MSDNMKLWNAVARPPENALRQINAGRLKGKSDISPQWRLKAMTEQVGPCGIGWDYAIDKLWTEPAPNGQMFAFALVSVTYQHETGWSHPVPGVGGHMLIVNEKNGAYANDEAYKMAVTDALSVALKSLGVAADIYMGLWDGSKYKDDAPQQSPQPEQTPYERYKPLIIEVVDKWPDKYKRPIGERMRKTDKHDTQAWRDIYDEVRAADAEQPREQPEGEPHLPDPQPADGGAPEEELF